MKLFEEISSTFGNGFITKRCKKQLKEASGSYQSRASPSSNDQHKKPNERQNTAKDNVGYGM